MPAQRRTLQGPTSPLPRILGNSASSPPPPLVFAGSPRRLATANPSETRRRILLSRLIGELSFKMPTLSNLSQTERKGQDGAPERCGPWYPNVGSVPGTASAMRGSSNNARSRCWNFEPTLRLGRVIDPGASALALQAPMGLRPGRRFGNFLQPIGDRSFIAPFRQSRHHATMCPGPHERAHRRFVAPHRTSPEGQIGVAKHGNPKVSDRMPSLTCDAKRLDKKCRQVAPRPHPKACDGDQRHGADRWGLVSISYQRPTN